MSLWKRPEVLWRALLVALLFLAGLVWPARESLPASGDLELEVPREETGQKLVAITFDDGPMAATTGMLLDGLEERGVRATFFLIGCQVQTNGELVQRMAREGHQIGVHTFDHVQVTGLDYWEYLEQVEGSRWAVWRVLGERELWLRPPYGILDENTLAWADSPVVLWSVDPEDWRDRDTGRITRHVLNHVRDGDILLLHDIYDSSVRAALDIVDALQQQGYRFVTVEELLALRGVEVQPGSVYRSARP